MAGRGSISRVKIDWAGVHRQVIQRWLKENQIKTIRIELGCPSAIASSSASTTPKPPVWLRALAGNYLSLGTIRSRKCLPVMMPMSLNISVWASPRKPA